MTSCAYGARSPRFHCDVILIVTSFATELATPTDTDTLPRLIYRDYKRAQLRQNCSRTANTVLDVTVTSA